MQERSRLKCPVACLPRSQPKTGNGYVAITSGFVVPRDVVQHGGQPKVVGIVGGHLGGD